MDLYYEHDPKHQKNKNYTMCCFRSDFPILFKMFVMCLNFLTQLKVASNYPGLKSFLYVQERPHAMSSSWARRKDVALNPLA